MRKQGSVQWLLPAAFAGLVACGKPADPAPAQLPTAAVAAAPAEAVNAPPPPSALAGEPVDTCAMLDAATATQSLGALITPPQAQEAQGSLLGGCNYMGDKGMLMLTARPDAEYRATVDFASKKGGARAVEGLAGEATVTLAGLMLQPAGKPYFLVIYPLINGKFDEALAVRLAGGLKI